MGTVRSAVKLPPASFTLRHEAISFGILLISLIVHWPVRNVAIAIKFSAPVMPTLGWLVALFPPLDYSRALQWLTFLLICAFPVSVYAFVITLTNRRFAGIASALVSLLPFFSTSRLLSAFFWGDTAHIVSLTFIPLGGVTLIRFLRSGGFRQALVASFMIALVGLTSPFGLFVNFIFLSMVTFSEVVISEGRIKLFRFITVSILGALMSQFWYTLGFVRILLTSDPGRELLTTIGNLIPLSFFLAPILGTAGFLLFEKRPRLQPFFIAGGLVVIFWLFSFAGRLSEGLYISEQGRYQADLSMATSLFAGVIAIAAYRALEIWLGHLLAVRQRFLPALITAVVIGVTASIWLGYNETTQLVANNDQVLGVFTEQIVGIGEIRQQTGLLDKFIGALVSGSTLGALIIASFRFPLRHA